MVTVELEALLTDLGAVWTFVQAKFTSILGLFATEPVLVLILGLMVIGGIIGLTMRVLHRR